MSDLEKILIQLSDAFGPSGFEKDIRNIFQREVAESAEIDYDNLGSIIAKHYGSSASPKILLAAHLDEVGLMVRGILPNGYLKVVPLGGWWAPTLVAQRVIIRDQNNHDHYGVMGAKPPHYMSDDERNRVLKINDLYIDLGARNAEEVAALGIKVGDPVVPAVKTEALSPSGALVGKAFDDRTGCAVIIKVLQELDTTHPNLVIGAGTVQEENGIKGAVSVASRIQPDLCIVVEGAPADDFPDAGPIKQGLLGGGPQVRYLDPSMIANQSLAKLAINTAEKQGIPYQVAVREGGGTDGREIQTSGNGVPCVVIGVPVRYAHSHQGIISLKDLKSTVQLVKALVYNLNETAVNDLKRNPWR
ncbi:MAG TPA: M42 family metallopeptidase [Bacillota bacterium]|nr:M42 family metallopeptidase [Bacillota bacterium]